MRQFTAEQLETFLQALDRELDAPFTFVLIGGAAGILAHEVHATSRDFDAFETDVGPIEEHLTRTREATGLDIPFSDTAVADAPHNYQDRLQEYFVKGATKLRVFVPEVHDWVLMKTLRADEGDLEAIKEVAKHDTLSLDIFVERYNDEMEHVIGEPILIRLAFLTMLERVFGKEAADEAETRVRR